MITCPHCHKTIDTTADDYEYKGYLSPHLETILRHLKSGDRPTNIARLLFPKKKIWDSSPEVIMIYYIRKRYNIYVDSQGIPESYSDEVYREARMLHVLMLMSTTKFDIHMAPMLGVSKGRVGSLIRQSIGEGRDREWGKDASVIKLVDWRVLSLLRRGDLYREAIHDHMRFLHSRENWTVKLLAETFGHKWYFGRGDEDGQRKYSYTQEILDGDR